MAEAYCFLILKGEVISTAGIGIVVLINGYLLMDSVRSTLKAYSEKFKFYMDHLTGEGAQKWDETYTEITNLQKALYTVSKKNLTALTEQSEEMLHKMEALEGKNTEQLHQIIALQEKTMEGMKNALRMSVNYNRDNTKQIIKVLQDNHKSEKLEQLDQVIALLEKNNGQFNLWEGYIEKVSENLAGMQKQLEVNEELLAAMEKKHDIYDAAAQDIVRELKVAFADFKEELAEKQNFYMVKKEEDNRFSSIDNQSSMSVNVLSESGEEKNETLPEGFDNFIEKDAVRDILGLEGSYNNIYIDLENEAGWEAAGIKFKTNVIDGTDIKENVEIKNETETKDDVEIKDDIEIKDDEETKDDIEIKRDDETKYDIEIKRDDESKYDIGIKHDDESKDDIEIKHAEETKNDFEINYNIETDNEIESTKNKVSNEEVYYPTDGQEYTGNVNVTPLYSDPNKKLTADEIAALFASMGK
jgi:hypothetical protein